MIVRRRLVLMVSLRIAGGRFTPFKRKYKPQALHTESPAMFRLHIEVALVPQFAQVRPTRLVAVEFLRTLRTNGR